MDIMTLLYDQKTVTEFYVESEKESARAEGKLEGVKDSFQTLLHNLMRLNPEMTQEEAWKMANELLPIKE